jgi:pilus assembly protein Flp/PilA
MHRFLVSLRMFWKEVTGKIDREKGATMLEYGIMITLIAIVVLLAVGPFGEAVRAFFTDATTQVDNL